MEQQLTIDGIDEDILGVDGVQLDQFGTHGLNTEHGRGASVLAVGASMMVEPH